MINNHLTDAVRRLIDSGCHYRLEALEKLYAPDLQIVIVQENGEAATFDYQQNMAFFRQLRDNNAPPLNTAVQFNYAAESATLPPPAGWIWAQAKRKSCLR